MSSPGSAVDLTNCDREPIHLLGAIQPFGFLLVVSESDWLIQRASTNVATSLNSDLTDLIGKPLALLFSIDAIHAIRNSLQTAAIGDNTARIFGLDVGKGLICDVAIHLNGNSIVIECEQQKNESPANSAGLVRAMLTRLQQTQNDRAFYRVAARDLRALTGFDRVMIYRFEENGAGEVIAEAARADLESYLGLHYPASDIPKQARVLYERNWLRIIPDIDAIPVPVEPQLDGMGRSLDLSLSVLRSVSSIHIEYLRNMGVRASMSISILRQGKLWGLFACHHHAPHHLGFGLRTSAELFGQMFSLMMENREREAESLYEQRAQSIHQRFLTAMATEGQQFASIVEHLEDVADLLTCDGIGLFANGTTTLRGHTPGKEQFESLINVLQQDELVDVISTNHIAEFFPAGKDFADRAAGMLVVPLSRPARDFLVFFREEVTRHVHWAGDPSKPVSSGPLGDRLTPRKSFELWKETVSGTSEPWRPVERRIAESLRVSLLEVILRITALTMEERKRAEDRQELLIAELNHRIRNIFGLIQGVLNQSKDPKLTIESFTKLVGGRIHALARAHDLIATTQGEGSVASLHALLEAEAAAYLMTKAERLMISGQDAELTPDATTTVALLLHEMITNSAKYGSLSDSRGRIEVATNFEASGHLRINWAEHDGPPVKPPLRRGFGSTVIEQSVRHGLKGDVMIEYAFTGLRANFLIPGAFVRQYERPSKASLQSELPAISSHAVPEDVLLVEDNMIIALDTEGMLRSMGVTTVRVTASVAEALRLISEQSPGFALLDVNLGNETSFAIADKLMELGLPFIFTSGYGESIVFGGKYAHVQRMRKPYTAEMLSKVLHDVSS